MSKHTAESFWARVDVGHTASCWNWKGSVTSSGYGSLSFHGYSCVAHRVAAYLCSMIDSVKQPAETANTFVLHKCDNRRCCNPSHFFLGSKHDNLQDAYNKKRKQQPQGHLHANSKLTPKDVRKIRKQYSLLSQDKLAVIYGVSQVAVSLILRGVTYRNVV